MIGRVFFLKKRVQDDKVFSCPRGLLFSIEHDLYLKSWTNWDSRTFFCLGDEFPAIGLQMDK